MYKNTDALYFGIIEQRAFDLSQNDARHNNHIVFVIFASLIVTVVFLVPFSDAWMRSVTYQDYFSADYVDSGTREGRLDRQIALGMLGLLGLAAVAWPGGKARAHRQRFDHFLCRIFGVVCRHRTLVGQCRHVRTSVDGADVRSFCRNGDRKTLLGPRVRMDCPGLHICLAMRGNRRGAIAEYL